MKYKWLLLFGSLTFVGFAAAAGCLAMTIIAAFYLEWGRVLLYGMLTLFSVEIFGFSLYKLVVLRRKKENP